VDSNSTEHFGQVAKNLRRQAAERGLHRRRLRQQARRRARRRHGKFKRYWGAYGNKPDDTNIGRYNPTPAAQQFRTPVHCAELSNDNLVYVAIVQRPDPGVHARGQVREGSVVSRRALGDGSTWDIAFSNDPQQKFIYLVDGKDERIWILDRQSLEILSSFGDGGKMPGQFFAVHSIATDSRGTSSRPRPTTADACRSSPTRGCRRDQGRGSRTVWPRSVDSLTLAGNG